MVGMLQQNLFDIYADQSFGAMDAARELGLDLITFCGRPLEDTGFKRQANVVYDLVGPESVDALVVWSSTLGIHVGSERMEAFRRQYSPLPVVAVEQALGDAPMVLMDNRSGMREAVAHLIEAHGHTRIAFVRGPTTHDGAEERYQGYLDAMRDHGLTVDPQLVSANSEPWTSDGIASPDAVVTCGVTSTDTEGVATGHAAEIDPEWLARILADPPEAVAAVNDGFAVAVVAALAGAGLSVPGDVAVVGFDDSINITSDELGFSEPSGDDGPAVDSLSLTTVRAPFWELGHRAVEVVARLLNGEPVDPVVTVPTELVVRRSCGCEPAEAPELSAPEERDWQYMQVIVEKRSQIVREIGQDLIAASDADELLDMLPGALSKIGIPSCYLASYHGDLPSPDDTETQVKRANRTATAWSDLLFACEDGVRLDITPDLEIFRSVELVPGDLLAGPRPRNTVLAPLYFTDEQLGFVLLEVGPRIGWLYETLQSQLSAALHRAFMVERERAALAAVEDAHRREERQRLAGDLHDSVSQALFSMNLHTRALQLMVERGNDSTRDAKMARGLEDLRDLTQTALSEMRALIFQLRPDALHNDGLVVAIRKQAAALSAREGLDILVDTSQDHFPLDERAESELFLFVREALHNCAKHAQAERIKVRLVEPGSVDGTLEIEVLDDGTGFDPRVRRPGHFGLDTMRERVEGLGGQFVIDSSPTTSTTVRAILPHILAGTNGSVRL